MSIIIKGIDVSSKCNMRPFADLDLFGMLWTCKVSGGGISEEMFSPPFDFRPNWCPIEPDRKKGKWINAYPKIKTDPMFMCVICSECGFEQSLSGKLNFCPNCGADMREEE